MEAERTSIAPEKKNLPLEQVDDDHDHQQVVASVAPSPPSSSSLPRRWDHFLHNAVFLLDLPRFSWVSVDSEAPLQPVRDDFCGLSPACRRRTLTSGVEFHWVTVRAALHQGTMAAAATTAVGFCLVLDDNDNNDNLDWPLVRRYHPRTEEMGAAAPLDRENVVHEFRRGHIAPHRLLSYYNDANVPHNINNINNNRWHARTGYVSRRLVRLRGLAHGQKVVPSFQDDDNDHHNDNKNKNKNNNGTTTTTRNNASMNDKEEDEDGRAVCYPPIPLVGDWGRHPEGPSRRTSHAGTRRFLAALTPAARTTLLVGPHVSQRALDYVLQHFYHNYWQDIVGDVQLAFVVFQQVHCYASWQHWRDLVAHLAQAFRSASAPVGDSSQQEESSLTPSYFVPLYTALVETLVAQLSSSSVPPQPAAARSTHDDETLPSRVGDTSSNVNDWMSSLLEESDFLRPALLALCHSPLRRCHATAETAASRLSWILPQTFGMDNKKNENDYAGATTSGVVQKEEDEPQNNNNRALTSADSVMTDNYDELELPEGAVVVAWSEVEAAMGRVAAEDAWYADRPTTTLLAENNTNNNKPPPPPQQQQQRSLGETYPLLWAAIRHPYEDVLMTCARVLDQANDVSLVREAAAYLENVEAQKGHQG